MNKRKTIWGSAILLTLILVVCFNRVVLDKTDHQPLVIGSQFQLDSRYLKESRTIYIHLPDGYEKGNKKYPVLYILDAEWLPAFAQAVATAHHLFEFRKMPEAIVVGICNKGRNRNRDMIPTVVRDRPGSGGSDKFLEFITSELMPHINQTYRTRPYNVLYGGSNAGLLVVYAFLTKTEHFQAGIAGSPMIGHCSDFMYDRARLFLKKETAANRRLYMIYGSNDFKRCVDYVPDYYKFLHANPTAALKCKLVVIPDGGHVPYVSLYEGLKTIFSK